MHGRLLAWTQESLEGQDGLGTMCLSLARRVPPHVGLSSLCCMLARSFRRRRPPPEGHDGLGTMCLFSQAKAATLFSQAKAATRGPGWPGHDVPLVAGEGRHPLFAGEGRHPVCLCGLSEPRGVGRHPMARAARRRWLRRRMRPRARRTCRAGLRTLCTRRRRLRHRRCRRRAAAPLRRRC
jgi:hypothetical protein